MREITVVLPPPERAPDAHKGTFGHLLVLGGSLRMTGAALLAAGAGLRSGAGLVTLGIPSGVHALIAPAMLSAMSLPLPPAGALAFTAESAPPALAFAEGVTGLALGPGVTAAESVVEFVIEVASRSPCPTVIDADGLNALARAGIRLDAAPGPRVLTPHPGEAARLLGRTVPEVQRDRVAAAEELARRHRAVAVLKGQGTVVTDSERYFVNHTGNPGMATGGAGDVLTGLIGGLLAQGMEPFDAAVLGVFLHGRAGDLAVVRCSQPALTAGDLLEYLGPAFLSL